MSILYKDDYLEKLKNAMLFHFSHKDILSTLEDISLLFESNTADGKTEAELCRELGTPKEFSHSLLSNKSSNKFRPFLLCIYTIICFIMCMLTFCYPSFLLSIITLLIIPISIWYLEGSYCLLKIRPDTIKNYKIYFLFSIISLILIFIEQIFTYLLHNDIRISNSLIITTFYASSAFIIISIATLITAIYKLHKGYYLSFGILPISIGVICSSLLYNDYIKRFSSPATSYNICSLPFILGLLMGVFYYWNILKKKDKKLWIHK